MFRSRSSLPEVVLQPRRRLYESVAEAIHAGIAEGRWPVGTRLPSERELSQWLGVSRPSVREALIALEVHGSVEVRGQSGVWVCAGAAEAAAPAGTPAWMSGGLDLLRARALIEGECAALAATHARREQVQALRLACERMGEQPAYTPLAAQADREFHLLVASAAGNQALQSLLAQLWQCAQQLPALARAAHEGWPLILDEHARVLAAIEARDAEAARAASLAHLTRVTQRYVSGGARPVA